MEVVTAGGRTERYQLPVGLLWDRDNPDGIPPLAHGLSMARVRQGSQVGLATGSFTSELFAREIVQALRAGSELRGPQETIRFKAEHGLAAMHPEREEIQWMSAEQSSNSLAYGNTAVLKLVRRLSGGCHPSRSDTLPDQPGLPALRPAAGRSGAHRRRWRATHADAAAGYIPTGNGWDWTLDYGPRDRRCLAGEGKRGQFIEAMSGYAAMATTLGRRLAELHEVLARSSEDPAFAPSPPARKSEQWARQALARLTHARTCWSAPSIPRSPRRSGSARMCSCCCRHAGPCPRWSSGSPPRRPAACRPVSTGIFTGRC